MTAVGLAFTSAALFAAALVEMSVAGGRRAGASVPALACSAAALADVLVRAGSEGHEPGASERRRLLAAFALVAFGLGAIIAGPLIGVAAGAGGPWLASRALRVRREHYRRAVEAGVANLCTTLADALGAGHSLRRALAEAAQALPGAAGHELRRVAAELEAGARTDDALEAMRARVRSAQLDTVVAACLVQRRAGGDLARLLRDSAEALSDQARLEHEVRSATAQARFTGVIVVLLPLGGGLLAELASPGFFMGLWGSFLTAWLVGIAIGLQVAAAVLIRRLGRVRW